MDRDDNIYNRLTNSQSFQILTLKNFIKYFMIVTRIAEAIIYSTQVLPKQTYLTDRHIRKLIVKKLDE